MRRALAMLLVAVFGSPLIAPILRANTDSDLPVCCRRGGQHHCAMSNMPDHGAETAFRAIQPKCLLFPKAGAAGGSFYSESPGSFPQIGALVALPSANRFRDENIPPIESRGSTQKRGPPSDLG